MSSSASEVAQLVTRYLPALRAFVRLRMGKELRATEESCDIVQSVTREILLHPERFQHGGEVGFRQWLFTTAHRKVVNRLSRLHTHKRGGGQMETDLPEALPGPTATPSHHASAREELAALEAAFDALTDEQREVVTAARILGMPHAEIAQRLGKTEVAVRKTLSRAIARLAAVLASEASTEAD